MILTIYVFVCVILALITCACVGYSKKCNKAFRKDNELLVGLCIVFWPLIVALLAVIIWALIMVAPSYMTSHEI